MCFHLFVSFSISFFHFFNHSITVDPTSPHYSPLPYPPLPPTSSPLHPSLPPPLSFSMGPVHMCFVFLHLWLNLFLGDFDAIINEIIFLVSISDSSQLVYKNETDFKIFVLYLTTLLNSFISIYKFLVVLGGIFNILYIQYLVICK